MKTIMYATQLCLLATFAGVLLAYRETVGSDTKAVYFAIPLSLLVFSLGQYWNMFHAWSIHVVVVNTFGVLAFLLLNELRGKERGMTVLLFVLAMLGGSAATLSAGHGLLVWPVGLVQLFLEPLFKRNKLYLSGVWTIVGVAHWAIFFLNYDNPASRMDRIYFFSSPTLGIDYFLGLVGFSLFLGSKLAIVSGATIMALLVFVIVWIVRNRDQEKYTFWISLSAFSLLILAATTVARAGKGIESSIHSKYVTFSVLLTISVYVMALKLARDHGRSELSSLPVGVCIGLIVLSAPLSYYSNVQTGQEVRVEREEKACVLINYEDRSNKALQQAFRPIRPPEVGKEVRYNAAILDDLNYTVFAPSTEAQSKLECEP